MVQGAAGLQATKGRRRVLRRGTGCDSRTPLGSPTTTSPAGNPNCCRQHWTWAARGDWRSWRRREAVEVVETFLGLWRQPLDGSDPTARCAVRAVAGSDGDLLDRAATIFRDRTDQLTRLLAQGGV